jgi:hypothetical protein
MNLFSTKTETGGHILKLNDSINMPQHNLHLLTESVVNAQKRVISPTDLMTVPETGGGSRYKLPRTGVLEGGPTKFHMLFLFVGSVIICRLYKLTLSDQAQTTLQLTVFLCSVNIFFPVCLCRGGPNHFQRPWLMDALIKEHTCFSKWHRIILSFEQGVSKTWY